MIKNYYAIKKGRESGVIKRSWGECSELVSGYSGAVFRGFKLKEDAIKWLLGTLSDKPVIKISRKTSQNKHPCLERKSFTDPGSGIYYKDHCVKRFMGTTTGEDYQPNNDLSIPWA